MTMKIIERSPRKLRFQCVVCDQVEVATLEGEASFPIDDEDALDVLARDAFRAHIDHCGSQRLLHSDEVRKRMTMVLNLLVQSDDPVAERARLEVAFDEVLDTEQMTARYEVLAFFAPFVRVRRKSDGVYGALAFQHHPRFYFDFTEEGAEQ